MSKISRRVAATAALVASVLVISEASANTLRMANSAPPRNSVGYANGAVDSECRKG